MKEPTKKEIVETSITEKEPKQIDFFHDCGEEGEQINEKTRIFGKADITVLYNDKICEIYANNIWVDSKLPYAKGNIYEIALGYLQDQGLL